MSWSRTTTSNAQWWRRESWPWETNRPSSRSSTPASRQWCVETSAPADVKVFNHTSKNIRLIYKGSRYLVLNLCVLLCVSVITSIFAFPTYIYLNGAPAEKIETELRPPFEYKVLLYDVNSVRRRGDSRSP